MLNGILLCSPIVHTVHLGTAWYQESVNIPSTVTTLVTRMLDTNQHKLLPLVRSLHLTCRIGASLEACPQVFQLSVDSANLCDFRTRSTPPLKVLTIQHLQTRRMYSSSALGKLQEVHLPHLVSLRVKSGDPASLKLLHAPKLKELELLTSEVSRHSYEDQLSCLLGSTTPNKRPSLRPMFLTIRVVGAEHVIPQLIASQPQLVSLTVHISSGRFDKLLLVLETLEEAIRLEDDTKAPQHCPNLKRLGIRLEWRRRDDCEIQTELSRLIALRTSLDEVTCDWADGATRRFTRSVRT